VHALASATTPHIATRRLRPAGVRRGEFSLRRLRMVGALLGGAMIAEFTPSAN
jgi:hypothetical protein